MRIGQDGSQPRRLGARQRGLVCSEIVFGGGFGPKDTVSPVNLLHCLLGSGQPKPLGLKVSPGEYCARRAGPAPLPGETN